MQENPRYRRHAIPAQTSEVEGRYFCDTCGQEVFVAMDISAGRHQDYVEECPVCGSPMVLHADIQPDGSTRIEGQRE